MSRNFAHRFFQVYFAREKLEEGVDITYFRCDEIRFRHEQIEIRNNSLIVLERDDTIHVLRARFIIVQQPQVIEAALIVCKC